jgi:ribonuclease HII
VLDTLPSDLSKFDQAVSEGCLRVAGVDEVGRGPLAGPVVAAAVVFKRPCCIFGLNDSKKLTEKKRKILISEIASSCYLSIASASVEEIDEINIYQASRLAMKRAVSYLPIEPELLLIDGNAKIDSEIKQKTIIKGDGKSAVIAAASIVAKVYRDAWMESYDSVLPGYSFSSHKGYGTKKHLEALQLLGPQSIHRKSFAPVASFFKKESHVL